jgi:fatty-acyl-CoA synthase
MPAGMEQTMRPLLWRAANFYPNKQIVSRTHTGENRYNYSSYSNRVNRLAHALTEYGIQQGDRVATLSWNHHKHFETYFSVPLIGAQLHTINPLLSSEQIQYILADADDQLIFVDRSFVPILKSAIDTISTIEKGDLILMDNSRMDDFDIPTYEEFIRSHPPTYDWPDLDENQPAGLCYTSGTTGDPKGVEYTHQMLWGHTMSMLTPQGIPITDDDTVMPVVPMFHVNAWGFPLAATTAGAGHVYPGPSPDSADIVELIEREKVTISAGVPSVWLKVIDYAENNEVNFTSLDTIAVGGSAVPKSMIRWFDTHDTEVIHAWGMTEASPIGTVSNLKSSLTDIEYESRVDQRAKQGIPLPGVEIQAIGDDGKKVPWDNETLGELWIRGPWITTEYFGHSDTSEESFENGWLRTGDIVTIDDEGYINIVDRAEDIIKSGGEWISSIKIENIIMKHDGVIETAVIGVPDEKWQERPAAFIIPDESINPNTLTDRITSHIESEYPSWWVPDTIEYVDKIPKTGTGKISKKDIREQYI